MATNLKWEFEFLGQKENKKYICIKTDDCKGNGLGISECYHYYTQNIEDKSLKSINYMSVPTFENKPSKLEATHLMDEITRFFHGWIPYNMEVANS